MKSILFLCVIPFTFLFYVSNGDVLRQNGVCSWIFYKNSSCPLSNFLCANRKCIERDLYCNGRNDCGDNSDEQYCSNRRNCLQSPVPMQKCKDTLKCIPEQWFCDGIPDCNAEVDEQFCVLEKTSIYNVKGKALQWLNMQKKNQSATEMWGPLVDKSAVALYLASNISSAGNNNTRKEMAYEVSIQLLSRLTRTKLGDIPSTVLASYVNTFLVTCLDPRKFHGIDIVQELRSRVDSQNYTNPYVLLSLCNAGDTITESDTEKLIHTFSTKRRAVWTDMQAVVVMTLACASLQPGNYVDSETLQELAMELKQHQYRNGTVENLQTTALVMQALISAERDADPDNFDEKKAMHQILMHQKPDGSFGSFMNAYFVLPVLNCKSLVNISSDHCEYMPRDEISALEDLKNRSGPKIRVQYSLWIGNEKDLERNLVLRVPANFSFYAIMEIAAEIDSRYRFEYVVKSRKPYINAISGLQDNPEEGKFWFLYTIEKGKHWMSHESPAEAIPKDDAHFVMWYRSGSWVD